MLGSRAQYSRPPRKRHLPSGSGDIELLSNHHPMNHGLIWMANSSSSNEINTSLIQHKWRGNSGNSWRNYRKDFRRGYGTGHIWRRKWKQYSASWQLCKKTKESNFNSFISAMDEIYNATMSLNNPDVAPIL